MKTILLDLPRGFSIELDVDINGIILDARWLWCDMPFGDARVGLA